MMWTLAHEYFLLALDDHAGTLLVADTILFETAIAAAWVGELMFADRLFAASAGKFALRPGPLGPDLLGWVEGRLANRSPSTSKACIARLHSASMVGKLRADLIDREVLRREQDKVWFIPYRTRHPAHDMTMEVSTRDRLRDHLAGASPADPPHRDDGLISLLRASKLLDQVWSPSEIVASRDRIEARTAMVPLGREAQQVTDELHAALAVATTIAIT